MWRRKKNGKIVLFFKRKSLKYVLLFMLFWCCHHVWSPSLKMTCKHVLSFCYVEASALKSFVELKQHTKTRHNVHHHGRITLDIGGLIRPSHIKIDNINTTQVNKLNLILSRPSCFFETLMRHVLT